MRPEMKGGVWLTPLNHSASRRFWHDICKGFTAPFNFAAKDVGDAKINGAVDPSRVIAWSRVRVDGEGNLVEEQEVSRDRCLVKNGVVEALVVVTFWHELARDYQHVFAVKLNVAAGQHLLLSEIFPRGLPILD